MSAFNDWDVTDANNNAAPPDGWPENTMQYSEVNDAGRAVQGTLKRFFADVNGSLAAGGSANTYTLTLNESGYTAYFEGMYFACSIPATNTGASTINVNGISIQTIVDRAGSALLAGQLQQDGLYEFRYDGTNFQLMGTAVGAAGLDTITLANTNDPDLVDTDVGLNVGSSDPDNNQHLELGNSDIQSKSDSTTAAQMNIQPLGGDTKIGVQSGTVTGQIEIFHGDGTTSLPCLRSTIRGISLLSIASPGVGSAQDQRLDLRQADGTRVGLLGFLNTTDLRIRGENDGGTVLLEGADSASANQIILEGNPDNVLTMYHAGVATLRTALLTVGGAQLHNGNDWIPIGAGAFAYQGGSSQTVGATLTDITNMLLSSIVLGTYRFEAYIPVGPTGGTVSSIGVLLNRTGGTDPEVHMAYELIDVDGTVYAYTIEDTGTPTERLLAFNNANNQHTVKITGTLNAITSAPTLQLQIRRVGGTGSVVVGGYSHMKLTRIDA